MTKEDVIELLKRAKKEQEPCDDAISRQDVLNLAKKGVLISNGNYESVCEAINELPSVTPHETVTEFADRCRECGREKVLDKIKTEIGKSKTEHEMKIAEKDIKAKLLISDIYCDVINIIDRYRVESEE